MEREVIPVIKSQAELQKLLLKEQGGYLLIKGRDLARTRLVNRSRIILQQGSEGRAWYLIALGERTAP
jgi:hypothetical protein